MNNVKQIVGCSLALAMLAVAAEAPVKPKANPAGRVKVVQEGMNSTSDSFNYNLKKRLAIYEGSVRVIDSTLDLSCDKLTVVFMDKADKPAPKAATLCGTVSSAGGRTGCWGRSSDWGTASTACPTKA